MEIDVLILSDFLAFCAERELRRNWWDSITMKYGAAFALDDAADEALGIAKKHGAVVDIAIFGCAVSRLTYEANKRLLEARRLRRIEFLQTYIEGLRKAMRLARTFAGSYSRGEVIDEN